MIYNWEALSKTSLYQTIIKDWQELLNDNKLKELDYHSFLYSNPAIFLIDDNAHLAISKLKLGDDYETDFVILILPYNR